MSPARPRGRPRADGGLLGSRDDRRPGASRRAAGRARRRLGRGGRRGRRARRQRAGDAIGRPPRALRACTLASGSRQSAIPTELQEPVLERRPGADGRRQQPSGEPTELAHAPLATAFAERTKPPAIEQVEAVGFVERTLELARGEHRREVEQGAGGRGDRDPVAGREVDPVKSGRAVEADRGTRSPTPRHAHVRDPARRRHQPPQLGGASVAEHGAGPAGEHRREPTPVVADRRVTDRVDPGVYRVQPARRDPAADRFPAQSAREQLVRRDDPVLASGERRNRSIGGAGGRGMGAPLASRSAFATAGVGIVDLGGHGGEAGGRERAGGAHRATETSAMCAALRFVDAARDREAGGRRRRRPDHAQPSRLAERLERAVRARAARGGRLGGGRRRGAGGADHRRRAGVLVGRRPARAARRRTARPPI